MKKCPVDDFNRAFIYTSYVFNNKNTLKPSGYARNRLIFTKVYFPFFMFSAVLNKLFILFIICAFSINAQQDKIFTAAEVMPEFPGGTDSIASYLRRSFQVYTTKGIKYDGKAYVNFVVNADGKILNPKIIKSTGNVYYDDKILRVIQNMPDWMPGKDSGRKVSVYVNLPILFGSYVSFEGLKRWTVEIKLQQFFYKNGQLKQTGYYRVFTTNKGTFALPINKHYGYRRNGSLKYI